MVSPARKLKPTSAIRTAKAPPPTEAENVIRPRKVHSLKSVAPSREAQTQDFELKPSKPIRKSPNAENIQTVPPEIYERFIGIGSKYYFPDGEPAFVDRGVKLTTRSENTEVIRSLVSIAQSRGWDRITVSGTEHFRKDVWFAAQQAGLQVKGYQPSEVEQAQLVRGLAARRPGREASESKEPQPSTASSHSAAKPSTHSSSPAARASAASPAHGRHRPDDGRGNLFVGQLIDHGRDTYRHDPREQSSYFVRLKTSDGEREVWGVDLERALRHSLSSARLGDEVTVRALSREAVTVPKRERDAEGRVVAETSLSTHRNEWLVERTDFLAGRESAARTFRNPKVSPQEAVKKHPELQGSYLKLQAVKLGAERDFKNPEDRERLLARARVLIAQSIERGEPLEPVRLRDPVAKHIQPKKDRERDPPLAR